MTTLSIIVGWIGVVLLLGAYYLVSANKISSQSASYQAVNLAGGIFVAWNSVNQAAWPSVAVNAVWSVIAIIALFAIIKGQRTPPPPRQ